MRNQRGATFVIFYTVLALLGLMLWTCTAGAQVRYGVVIGPARDTMEAAWQTNVEQAYCVSADTVFLANDLHANDSLFVVGRVVRARTYSAGHDSVDFSCPQGHASVHTHPGMQKPRVADCNPSRDDWRALEKSRERYAVIQCAPTAFVFFFATMDPLANHTVFFNPGDRP